MNRSSEKKAFFQKIGLSHAHFHMEPVTPYKVLEKTNEPIPRKLLDGRTEGQTLIYKALQATAGDPISSTLKVHLRNCNELYKKLITISKKSLFQSPYRFLTYWKNF